MRANEVELKAMMIEGLAGNAKVHAALLSALVPILRRFYFRYVRTGSDDVEDLVQETLIAIHTKRATYERTRPFTTWMFAIARYKMIDHFRRNGRFCSINSLEEILVSEGFETASSARMDVERLLETLPAKQASAIRRTKLEGFTISEAATLDGIGESDTKVSIHRGIKALAAKISWSRS